jgi:hypothetical protein
MRYQEPIYIQNDNGAVRNKDILNVNMSSDICVFQAPLFSVSGAYKLNCSGSTGTTYVVTTATTIPLSFNFTGNVNTFSATNATFNYEIYQYNTNSGIFLLPPVYQSNVISYSTFSGTNILTQSVPITSLNLDGEYLIKGYYQFSACTNFLNLLGKTVNTLSYRSGSEYGLYDNDLDYYFIAFKGADKPKLLFNGSNSPNANSLSQQVIVPTDGQTVFIITNSYSGRFIFTLNGLVLSPNYDYAFSGNVVTLMDSCKSTDIITVTYTTAGANTLAGDNIYITSAIVSGTTDNQGTNSAYYNTTTGKYEIYTSVEPATNNTAVVMINGITLANNIDYYQSTSNLKRIILSGNIMIGDLITIIYFPSVSAVNGLGTSTPVVSWQITNPPQTTAGTFTLQVSTASTFSTLYASKSQGYVVNKMVYLDSFTASGSVGTTLYYRVKNEKNYITICGNILTDTAYSDVIPVVIQSNAINSY